MLRFSSRSLFGALHLIVCVCASSRGAQHFSSSLNVGSSIVLLLLLLCSEFNSEAFPQEEKGLCCVAVDWKALYIFTFRKSVQVESQIRLP